MAPTVTPPIPQDSTEPADDAPNSTLKEPAPEEESTEGGNASPPPPPDEGTYRPSAPAEHPRPLLPAASQAQCRDGSLPVFGLEDEDECLSFVASQGKSEPKKDQEE